MTDKRSEILNYFANYIESQLGIVYLEANHYQLEHRLKDLAVMLGMSGVEELYEKAQSGINGEMKKLLLDYATNNETSFFRDQSIFRALSNYIIPAICEEEKSRIDIWSAAASSGQEPYSIAMILAEYRKLRQIPPVSMLVSDVSEKMIKRIEEGTYTNLEVGRGLTPDLRDQYFEQLGPDKWSVKPVLREGIRTRKINLLEDNSDYNTFNVIFVRNVLIYQKVENKKKVIDRLYEQLKPKGFIILGAAESLFGVSDKFMQVAHDGAIFYQKP